MDALLRSVKQSRAEVSGVAKLIRPRDRGEDASSETVAVSAHLRLAALMAG